MKRQGFLILTIIAAYIIMLSGCATTGRNMEQSQTPHETIVTGINVTDNAVEIQADSPFVYTVYKPSDPYRVTVDIPDARVNSLEKMTSKNAGITEIVPSQIETPKMTARIEMLLQSPAEVEPVYQGKSLVLRLKTIEPNPEENKAPAAPSTTEPPTPADTDNTGKASVPETASQKPESTEESSEAKAKEPGSMETASVTEEPLLPRATEIIDANLAGSDGTTKIVIKGNGSMMPAAFTLKNRIIIDIPGAIIKTKMPASASLPVKGIRAGQHKNRARIVVDLKEDYPFDVKAVKDMIIVTVTGPEPIAKKKEPAVQAAQEKEIKPESPADAVKEEPEKIGIKPGEKDLDALEEGRYTGKSLSLDFQDADIVPIFRLLADISGYNMVLSPDVKGKLTMKLINVPWDQALELMLKTFNLGKSVEGNIIRIAPLSVFAKENEEKAKAKEAEVRSEPLETRIFPINYADVAVVDAAVKNSKMLSARGSLSVDKRTSSMVVKDVPSVFPHIEQLLSTLDKAIPQVMIEARIVEINTSDSWDLGIQWGFSATAENTLAGFGGNTGLNTGSFTGGNYIVDFPSGSAAKGSGSGFTFGLINPAKTLGLDMQLSALEKIGKSRMISNPRVVTTDNVEAVITQGTSEPFPKIDVTSGQISAEYKDIVLTTRVNPHITPAGSVNMVIDVIKEDILNTVKIGGSDVPRTSKINSKTTVLVQDGETVVIGGVYKKSESNSSSGVPGLTKVPILGELFKSRSNKVDTAEILIFITPRVIEKP